MSIPISHLKQVPVPWQNRLREEAGLETMAGKGRVDYCKLPEPHGTWARWVVEQAVAEVQKARDNAEEVDRKDPATQSISPLGSVSDFLNPIFFTTWFST